MGEPKHRLKYAQARRLRRELTPPEARLWLRLKGRQDGLHFRKQHPVGPFIVDFYCASARLVVEVEGLVHDLSDVAERDAHGVAGGSVPGGHAPAGVGHHARSR